MYVPLVDYLLTVVVYVLKRVAIQAAACEQLRTGHSRGRQSDDRQKRAIRDEELGLNYDMWRMVWV